ncbi:MAG: hypothetical protein ACXVB4_13425 [Pseudobdellovibrionaceae bacterium]
MRRILLISIPLLLAGCGTTSKKLMDLPPLAENAPVQVFWSQPNLKYDRVCEIEAKGNNSFGGMYTKKEDFEPMFKQEARKCGADGVIFSFLSGYSQGSVTAYGTGIKIKGQAAGLIAEDKIKAFSLAIQTHDLNKTKEILASVPKAKSERAPTDDQLVNLGLYIATLDGMNCDQKIVDLLEKEYEAVVPKFKAINLYSIDKNDQNSPLCSDVMARSLPKMSDISQAVLEVNNHYVEQLNRTFDKDLDKKVAKYNSLLKEASRIIADACKRSNTDSTCAMKNGYLDFANKTKAVKLPAVKKNAADVIKILGV